jgi:hypothetical protein
MNGKRTTVLSQGQRFCLMVVANTCLFGGLLMAVASLVLWQMGLASPGGDLENWAISGCFLCVFALIFGTIVRIHELSRRLSALEERTASESNDQDANDQDANDQDANSQ